MTIEGLLDLLRINAKDCGKTGPLRHTNLVVDASNLAYWLYRRGFDGVLDRTELFNCDLVGFRSHLKKFFLKLKRNHVSCLLAFRGLQVDGPMEWDHETYLNAAITKQNKALHFHSNIGQDNKHSSDFLIKESLVGVMRRLAIELEISMLQSPYGAVTPMEMFSRIVNYCPILTNNTSCFAISDNIQLISIHDFIDQNFRNKGVYESNLVATIYKLDLLRQFYPKLNTNHLKWLYAAYRPGVMLNINEILKGEVTRSDRSSEHIRIDKRNPKTIAMANLLEWCQNKSLRNLIELYNCLVMRPYDKLDFDYIEMKIDSITKEGGMEVILHSIYGDPKPRNVSGSYGLYGPIGPSIYLMNVMMKAASMPQVGLDLLFGQKPVFWGLCGPGREDYSFAPIVPFLQVTKQILSPSSSKVEPLIYYVLRPSEKYASIQSPRLVKTNLIRELKKFGSLRDKDVHWLMKADVRDKLKLLLATMDASEEKLARVIASKGRHIHPKVYQEYIIIQLLLDYLAEFPTWKSNINNLLKRAINIAIRNKSDELFRNNEESSDDRKSTIEIEELNYWLSTDSYKCFLYHMSLFQSALDGFEILNCILGQPMKVPHYEYFMNGLEIASDISFLLADDDCEQVG